jgi:hypothetical protein
MKKTAPLLANINANVMPFELHEAGQSADEKKPRKTRLLHERESRMSEKSSTNVDVATARL